jgi:hypothetical protein
MSNFSEDERRLIRGLEALAGFDEAAPPAVKARLQAEFQQTARWRDVPWFTLAATIAVLAFTLLRPAPHPPSAAPPDLASFIPLDSSPVSAGIVVRVKLPRAQVFDEGGPGIVEADVLLGDDGLAHAVKFIQ